VIAYSIPAASKIAAHVFGFSVRPACIGNYQAGPAGVPKHRVAASLSHLSPAGALQRAHGFCCRESVDARHSDTVACGGNHRADSVRGGSSREHE
jgi:hypothetical protein